MVLAYKGYKAAHYIDPLSIKACLGTGNIKKKKRHYIYFYHFNTKETKKMSEESTDQAAPVQLLRKSQSKIPWKVFPDTQRARR